MTAERRRPLASVAALPPVPAPATSNAAERVTLTVPEVALILGISRNEAYLAVQRGELPARRIGRRILIPRVALERWLAETVPRRRC